MLSGVELLLLSCTARNLNHWLVQEEFSTKGMLCRSVHKTRIKDKEIASHRSNRDNTTLNLHSNDRVQRLASQL